ncbi:MAG: metal-sensitive transcriptional regulator [Firmicutes bacterium]|nr:metal-sensitive transcriptional regulator [Bacillota bacterium]MCL5038821.1 metal-sensitive transcriptional regulator [Bacillota bacterium]
MGRLGDTKEMLQRIRRIEGQARGITRMLEEERECEDILVQLAAMREAINMVGMKLIGNQMKACIPEELYKEEEGKKAVEKAIRLFLKFS